MGSMLRKTLFFSSLMGCGSSAVGGSMAMNTDMEQVRHHHLAVSTRLFVEAAAPAQAQRFLHIDQHVVDEDAVPDRLEQAVATPV